MYLIALGANLPSRAGPPRATLEAALTALGARGLTVVSRSVWYRAPAYPPGSGPDFVNGAAMLETALEPAGRCWRRCTRSSMIWGAAGARAGSRGSAISTCSPAAGWCCPTGKPRCAGRGRRPADQAREAPPELILPHPRLHQRGFVLAPLNDIAPGWVHPLLRRSVREMLDALPAEDRAGIVPL